MFSKASTAPLQTPDTKVEVNKSVPSIISADLNIEGNLVSSGEIQVDGNVHGDIRCKVLIVGIKGQITGEVNAQTVRMHGAIKGLDCPDGGRCRARELGDRARRLHGRPLQAHHRCQHYACARCTSAGTRYASYQRRCKDRAGRWLIRRAASQ